MGDLVYADASSGQYNLGSKVEIVDVAVKVLNTIKHDSLTQIPILL